MGKSLTTRGIARKQRMLPAGKMWKEHMEEKFNSEMPPICKLPATEVAGGTE